MTVRLVADFRSFVDHDLHLDLDWMSRLRQNDDLLDAAKDTTKSLQQIYNKSNPNHTHVIGCRLVVQLIE